MLEEKILVEIRVYGVDCSPPSTPPSRPVTKHYVSLLIKETITQQRERNTPLFYVHKTYVTYNNITKYKNIKYKQHITYNKNMFYTLAKTKGGQIYLNFVTEQSSH